ncbi:MAG: hypothetical protein KAR33_11165 [Candidatus Thorarchaeota archaeon]|nr:hypothetical protein [Candidatus Thorarchaeota archaeon]
MKRIEAHRKKLLLGCPVILIIGLLLGIMMIPVIEQANFELVVEYVNNDPRNPAPITYACPNCTSETGWSYTEWFWGGDLFINWNQVELFLTSLEYHNKTVYRCDFYSTDRNELPWTMFLWFQKGEYRYEFLMASTSYLERLYFTIKQS